jgi:hypothetical protein
MDSELTRVQVFMPWYVELINDWTAVDRLMVIAAASLLTQSSFATPIWQAACLRTFIVDLMYAIHVTHNLNRSCNS